MEVNKQTKNIEKKIDITTLKLSKETKERIDKLKVHKRETYDDLLQRMLDLLTLSRNSPGRAQAKLIDIEKQKRLQEIK